MLRASDHELIGGSDSSHHARYRNENLAVKYVPPLRTPRGRIYTGVILMPIWPDGGVALEAVALGARLRTGETGIETSCVRYPDRWERDRSIPRPPPCRQRPRAHLGLLRATLASLCPLLTGPPAQPSATAYKTLKTNSNTQICKRESGPV